MLLSRRNMLLLSALLLTEYAASAQPPVAVPQFRLTVWTIRPVAKTLPTSEELQKDLSRWAFLHGFDKDQIRITSDPKILEALQKANPLYSIPRFEQKKVVMVPVDTPTGAVMAGGAVVKITIKAKDQEATYAEITQAKGKEIADLFRRLPAQEMILLQEIQVPRLDTASHPTPKMSGSKGYTSVKLNLIYAEDSTVSYSSTLVRAGENGRPNEYKVQQQPKYIVLYCLEPMTRKGERK